MADTIEQAPPDGAAAAPDGAAADQLKPAKTIEVEEDTLPISETLSELPDGPPPIFGYLGKKSPGLWRMGGWDRRFFVLADGKLMWWKDKQFCVAVSARQSQKRASLISQENQAGSKGMIDLTLSPAIVEPDKSNPTIFRLRPASTWRKGSTSDVRDDENRVYIFDAKGTENSREEWVQAFTQHIEFVENGGGFDPDDEKHGTSTTDRRGSEVWTDDTISPEQAAAAARLIRKLQARKKF